MRPQVGNLHPNKHDCVKSRALSPFFINSATTGTTKAKDEVKRFNNAVRRVILSIFAGHNLRREIRQPESLCETIIKIINPPSNAADRRETIRRRFQDHHNCRGFGISLHDNGIVKKIPCDSMKNLNISKNKYRFIIPRPHKQYQSTANISILVISLMYPLIYSRYPNNFNTNYK